MEVILVKTIRFSIFLWHWIDVSNNFPIPLNDCVSMLVLESHQWNSALQLEEFRVISSKWTHYQTYIFIYRLCNSRRFFPDHIWKISSKVKITLTIIPSNSPISEGKGKEGNRSLTPPQIAIRLSTDSLNDSSEHREID